MTHTALLPLGIYTDSALLFTLTHEDTAPPYRGSAHAAGWDLTADETVTIPVGGMRMVSTGITPAYDESPLDLLPGDMDEVEQ